MRRVFEVDTEGPLQFSVSRVALGVAVVTHFLPRDTVASLRGRFIALAPELKAAVYAGVLGLVMNSASLERPFIYFQF